MGIEEIVENGPDSISRAFVVPAVGMQAFQACELAFQVGLAVPPIT